MINKLKNLVLSPYFVIAIVIAMYILKVGLKVGMGQWVNSPVLIGDGLHNLSDIFEALLILATIYISKLPRSKTYPFGKKNIESIAVLGVGSIMFILAIGIAGKSIVELIAYWPEGYNYINSIVTLPRSKPLLMGSEYAGPIFAVVGFSCLASIAMSRYQIYIGKRSGHPSMAADGQETASDGKIEFVTLIGISSEYLFDARWIEYVLALVIAVLIFRTAYEIFSKGITALLQKTIGLDKELKINELLKRVEGTKGIKDMITFAVGPTAVCLVLVTTNCGKDKRKHMRVAIKERITNYLIQEEEYPEAEVYVDFELDNSDSHREAFPIIRSDDRSYVLACCLDQATHISICQVENGKIVRATEHPRDEFESYDAMAAFLKDKRVRSVYVFDKSANPAEQLAIHDVGINYRQTHI